MKSVYRTSDIGEIFGVAVQMTPEMMQSIRLWQDMYQGNPPWLEPDKDKAKRQVLVNVPSLLAWDLAKKAVSEFTVTATKADTNPAAGQKPFEDENASAFVEDAIKPFIRREVEYAIAMGGVLVRPYWDAVEQRIKSSWYSADSIFPISWDGNTLTGVVLLESVKRKERNIEVNYSKLEAHIPFCKHLSDGIKRGYIIRNRCFKTKGSLIADALGDVSLGEPCPLDEVEGWSHLEEETVIASCEKPLFAYMGMPCANNIDFNSPLGCAIFKDAIDEIRELDDNYTGFSWEMRSGEAKLLISDSIVPRDIKNGRIVARTNPLERAWMLSLDTTQDEVFKEYAPALRVESYVTAIRQNLAMICLLCHLDPSSFVWDAKTGAITATEVISKNQATYETIVDIQEKMVRPAVESFINASRTLLALYADDEAAKQLPDDLEFSISFGDSILMDEASEKASAISECNAGLRSKLSYLMDYRGMTEEEARKELSDIEMETPRIETGAFGGGF